MEGAFEDILQSLQPSPHVFKLVQVLFQKGWDAFNQNGERRRREAQGVLTRLEDESAKLVKRIVATDSETLASAYEAELKRLEEEKIQLRENINEIGRPLASFEALYRTACAFLENPYRLWASDKFEHKRLVLRLAFPQRLAYCRNKGYRTAAIAEPFRVLGDFCEKKFGMVELGGIEPPTSCMPCKRSPI